MLKFQEGEKVALTEVALKEAQTLGKDARVVINALVDCGLDPKRLLFSGSNSARLPTILDTGTETGTNLVTGDTYPRFLRPDRIHREDYPHAIDHAARRIRPATTDDDPILVIYDVTQFKRGGFPGRFPEEFHCKGDPTKALIGIIKLVYTK